MRKALSAAALLFCLAAQGQKVIFQSAQTYTPAQLETFYASVTLQQNLLLFNAPDYNLYAYDKNTGALKWTTQLGWKSDTPPFFVQGYILANNRKERVVQLDTATGSLLKTLPFYNISSQPLVKEGILYTTAIYDAGNLLAYDPRFDTVLWYRFLAHGYERAPYYRTDRIWANGEGDTWFEFDYKGRIITPSCDSTDSEAPWTPSCSHTFAAFTHDGRKIDEKAAKRLNLSSLDQPDVLYTPGATLLLADDILYTIGNRLKRKGTKPLADLLPEGEGEDPFAPRQLLKAGDDAVWLLYNNRLLVYDFEKNRLQQSIDLSAWKPHRLLPDGDRVWFVSRKDGLLYCIQVI